MFDSEYESQIESAKKGDSMTEQSSLIVYQGRYSLDQSDS